MSCVKAPDLMTSKKRARSNYFSVGVNDDPVICDKSSDTFEIVLNDCSRERLFEFQEFFFCFHSLAFPSGGLDIAR